MSYTPEELAELYFNRDPYPDFGFDLQLIVNLVCAQIKAAPAWAAVNYNSGELDSFRAVAIGELAKIKRDLRELKQIRNASDEHKVL